MLRLELLLRLRLASMVIPLGVIWERTRGRPDWTVTRARF
jgi:hypothetical protein